MAAEHYPFFSDLAVFGQRIDLEATRIGEDRAVPAVELVESAGFLQDVETWAKVEVIGVAEDDLCLHIVLEFAEVETLHRTDGAYGHEDRCLYLSVVGMDFAGTCPAVAVCGLKIECHRMCLSAGIIVAVCVRWHDWHRLPFSRNRQSR